MSTPRRQFLGLLGAGSFAALGGSALTPRPLAAEAHDAPVDDKWDMSWVDRVSGKYKAVFDSTAVEEGSGLFRACMWIQNYKTVYDSERSAMSPVVVFRHMAIPLVMNDSYWEEFQVGKEEKIKDGATNKWTKINPIRVAAKDMPPEWADCNLTTFLEQGGVVLGCRIAFGQVIYNYKTRFKLPKEDAEARARANLIPGVILQPSGVFAVLRAQEAGCSYIKAS